jgi:hypothetical protein
VHFSFLAHLLSHRVILALCRFIRKLQSYKQVLPRTLSIPLVGVWEQVVQEYKAANPDEDESLESFAKTLKAFIACHATEDDRHKLVSVIQYASKPDNMKVQPFFYRLKELNDYVHYLPGDEPALTDAQLNLAFYNGMPGHWRVRHAISGRSAHTTTCAELLHCFCVEEHRQLNNAKKLQMSMACGKNSNCAEHREKKFAGHFKGKQAEHVNKGRRVVKQDKCPSET